MSFLHDAEPLPGVESSTTWRFTVAADAPHFAGHFAGEPVLPGVAHIAVALEACGRVRPDLPVLAAVEDLRFMQPLLPELPCEVTVSARSATSARFDIRCDGVASSRGVLVFAGAWTPAP